MKDLSVKLSWLFFIRLAGLIVGLCMIMFALFLCNLMGWRGLRFDGKMVVVFIILNGVLLLLPVFLFQKSKMLRILYIFINIMFLVFLIFLSSLFVLQSPWYPCIELAMISLVFLVVLCHLICVRKKVSSPDL